MRSVVVALLPLLAWFDVTAQEAADVKQRSGVEAFGTVYQVFQHPRCSNCHIPGDAPLQFDTSVRHAMNVSRGAKGHGAAGFMCAACHGERNAPAAFGPHAPPGAPHWGLPPPERKMAWIGLSPADTCRRIQDRKFNGDRDLVALLKHVTEDRLVLWGWNPGGNRTPVPVPHAEFVAKFKQWTEAGAPCPTP